MITILANDQVVKTEARVEGNMLWVHETELMNSTGFELKPSGVCYPKLDICIPLFGDEFHEERADGKWLNLSLLSQEIEQSCISSDDQSVWSLGVIPQEREQMLSTGMAPDFEIKDIHGNSVCLSDFRGKKVLIVTWATWCGCRFDVKSWQKLYEELDDPNFEIICVAQDSQGDEVARKWFIDAKATFHCVVDVQHKISTVFGWVNVPTGAWIDEEGKIVRVNEAAYAEKHQINNFLSKTEFGNDAFGNATKEWVKNGLSADLEQSKEKLSANIRSQGKGDFEADAWFKLGLHFQKAGNNEEAEKYFAKARELAPNNWNIQRQSWTFKGTMHAIKNWNKITRSNFSENEDWTYYEPMDLEGAPTRRTTRIVFVWERIGQWCKGLLAAGK